MTNQLLESLFDIAGNHATDEQLEKLALACTTALQATTIDITTIGSLFVKAEGANTMGGHLIENLGDHAQDLFNLKECIEFVQKQRQGGKQS